MPELRWVGIDQGYSQMGLAVLDARGQVLASAQSRGPVGNGHDREVALARLVRLLAAVDGLRHAPVRLAGYCYQHSGVCEAFAEAGWTVLGVKALNDVMGVYGLTEMHGHVLVAGCGTFSQVVYVDDQQAVRWPGDDVTEQLPEWLLSGGAYARFVVDSARQQTGAPTADPMRRVAEVLGAVPAEPTPPHWAKLGPILSGMVDAPATRAFVRQAGASVIATRDVFWRNLATVQPPDVVLGGGAVRDARLWALLAEQWRAQGARVTRAVGDPAVGLARFAMSYPEADAWAVIGHRRPAWLQ